MTHAPADLLHRLREHGQEHVLAHWDALDRGQRERLAEQLAGIDLQLLRELYAQRDARPPHSDVERIEPLPVREAADIGPEMTAVGRAALERGEVAALVVAGGQGSRLGFLQPKGMFPVGPVSGKSLFQVHAEKVLALSRRYGRPVPFLVMTSPATHDPTVAYFVENEFFGLPAD